MSHLKKKDWIVKKITLDLALSVVEEFHYAKSGPKQASICFGLFPKNSFWNIDIQGAAIFLPPPHGVIKKYNVEPNQALSLSRLAISPSVPTNGASFIIGASIKAIKKTMKNISLLVTYADRSQGHTGQIYRATNWDYGGLTPPAYAWIDKGGRLVSKYANKTRKTDFMDMNYTRIGPFQKHHFYMWLQKQKKIIL